MKNEGSTDITQPLPERKPKKKLAIYAAAIILALAIITTAAYYGLQATGLATLNQTENQTEANEQADKNLRLPTNITIIPAETVIDYDTERTKTIELKLTNRLNQDIDVTLKTKGPLTEYFSWEGSMIRMHANETEKKILINIRLPSNLGAGEYEHKITARYVPTESPYKFTGTTPAAEAYIKIVNREY
jgi:hypothetical protein